MKTTGSSLTCPDLIDRARECEEIASVIASARAREGNALLMRGQAGIGKSRLIATALDGIDTEDLVLFGNCARLLQGTGLAPFTDALLSATRFIEMPKSDLLEPFSLALGAVIPHWARGPKPGDLTPVVIGEALCRLLDHLAGKASVVLVLEDLHWADADSIAVLQYMVHHLKGLPICILLSSRDDDPVAPSSLAEFAKSLRVLDLPPLTSNEVRTMIDACLGDRTVSDELVTHIASFAEGLPLLVEELLTVNGNSLPSRFTDVVMQRLEAVPAEFRDVIQLAAIVGEPVDVDLLCLASRSEVGEVHEALDHAVAAQLMTVTESGFVFRHALTGEIIRGSMRIDVYRDMCGHIATILSTDKCPSHAKASELFSAAGRPADAAASFLEAASQAALRGYLLSAVELYDRTLELECPMHIRRRALEGLPEVLVASGHVDRAVVVGGTALDQVAPSRNDATRIRLLLTAVHIQRREKDLATIHLEAAQNNHPTERATVAQLRLTEAQFALAFEQSDRVSTTRHLAAQAVGLAESVGDHSLACEALEVASLCERDKSLSDALKPLERILEIAQTSDLGIWRLRALNEIGTIEVLRDATGHRLERARDEAIGLSAPATLASIELNLASLHLMCGSIEKACTAAQTCRNLAEPLGLIGLVAASIATEGIAAGFDSRANDQSRLLRQAEKLASEDPDLLALIWAAGRGMTYLLGDDRKSARAAFERADRFPVPARTLNPARGPLLLVLATEGHDVTDGIVESLAATTPDARYPNVWLLFAQAVDLGRRGQISQAESSFRQAQQFAGPYPLFRAIAFRLVAEGALRDTWGTPLEWLKEAENEFLARGHNRNASACRTLLKKAGSPTTRRRGTDTNVQSPLFDIGVTAREAEVLELIVERLTNREIAERLYLSPRTVEKHVSNLLMKCDCENRRALISWADRLPASS